MSAPQIAGPNYIGVVLPLAAMALLIFVMIG